MGPLLSETQCCNLVRLEITQLHCGTSPSSAQVAVCKYKQGILTIEIKSCGTIQTQINFIKNRRRRYTLLHHLANLRLNFL
jgi:hypothetical protein